MKKNEIFSVIPINLTLLENQGLGSLQALTLFNPMKYLLTNDKTMKVYTQGPKWTIPQKSDEVDLRSKPWRRLWESRA